MTFHNLPACRSVVDKVPDVSHGTAQFREATSGMIGVKTVSTGVFFCSFNSKFHPVGIRNRDLCRDGSTRAVTIWEYHLGVGQQGSRAAVVGGTGAT